MTTVEEVDFVVVGGGSAGCIVAARLAEAGHMTILLEAGPADTNPLIHVPAGVRYLLNDPRSAWLDQTEANPDAGERKLAWPHGRVLGGSGSINGMIFVRGLPADFALWAQSGCVGWSYEDVLPHFRRLEQFRGPPAEARGTDGPLPVETARFRLPITRAFVAAAESRGHKRARDINAAIDMGVGYAQMNRFGRFRGSSARAFLPRGRRSGRLRVVTRATAEKLVFDGGRCTGVMYTRAGQRRLLRTRCEVIVSGGAIGSPKLLQLSGVGAAGALTRAGIAVQHDLPGVGENLVDHYGVRLAIRLTNAASVNELSYPPRLWWEVLKWITLGRGVLTTGVTTAMLFCKSRPELHGPDLQLLFSPSSFDANRYGQLEREPGASISVCLSRPESRGRVCVRSPRPDEAPKIEANYLSAPGDLDALTAGVAEARAIFQTAPFRRFDGGETLPGAPVTGERLASFVRTNGVTIYHPVGTCKMGLDPRAVTNPSLKVHGVGGLRVIDASVMPYITSGNTNATTMMIAEKGSAAIIEEWANRGR